MRGAVLALAIVLVPAVASAEEPARDTGKSSVPRLTLGGGGIVVPINGGVFGYAGQVGLSSERGPWDLRANATFYGAVDRDTLARGAHVHAQALRWMGPSHGFGFGGGAGYADFVNRTGEGWDGGAWSAGGYVVPLTLRFGKSPRIEPAVQLGVFHYIAYDIKPWAMLSSTIVF